jgi:hypothetical protein
MNNNTSIRTLDANYVAEFDESQWVCLLVADGPRLNFRPTSVLRLRAFLHDPTQQSSTISETYHVERSSAEGMILRTGKHSYHLSALATQQLRDFLNQTTSP